jgi:peptidoglycan-associated lipoprotein
MSARLTMGPGVLGAAVALVLAVAGCLGGCATEAPAKVPRTIVVLLPDEDGKVGSVSVQTAAGTQWIHQAFDVVSVDGPQTAPSMARPMPREAMDRAYGHLLRSQPPKPVTITLYFLIGTAVLTDESKAQLPSLLGAIRQRTPAEIAIFGHADATGRPELNLKLSAERARVIADLIKASEPTLEHIDVQFFGDTLPLYPHGAQGPDPRNRRTEVIVL